MDVRVLLLCGLLTTPLSAGDEAAAPVAYSIPLPERTYNGEWAAMLEFRAIKKGVVIFALSGLDSNGLRVFEAPGQELGLDQIHQFHLPARKKEAVQSLALLCSEPVTGMLWVHHASSGQLMGLPLLAASENPLTVVHLPKNYLVWKSSLALIGAAGSEESASVFLSYYTETQFQPREELIAPTLADRAYVRRTPNVDILIGGLASPAPPLWGTVKASPGFFLAGYQTFARQDGQIQTAGLEMSANLENSGTFLWDLGMVGLRQSLALANPHAQEIEIEWTALVVHQGDDQPASLERLTVTTLLGQGRNKLTTPEELFDLTHVDEILAVEYRVLSAAEEKPLTAMVSRFAMGAQDQGMGADTATEPRSELLGWLSFGGDFETAFRVANLMDHTTRLEWRISTSDQHSLLGFETLQPGQVLQFDREELQRRATDLGWHLDDSIAWARVHLRQESITLDEPLLPALLGQQVAKTASDFALIASPR